MLAILQLLHRMAVVGGLGAYISQFGQTMLDERTTEQLDLRAGRTPWQAGYTRPVYPAISESLRCGVLIVGAGITGSLAAEHLTRSGHDVIVIDRERPGYGSTAASTAMLLWETDTSLTELTDLYGFEKAASVYRRSLEAVAGLTTLVESLALACDLRRRNTLYLASAETGSRELREEHDLRTRAQLPGRFLDYHALLDEFAIVREAALVSTGAAEANPLKLAHALLQVAVARGARAFDAQAKAYDYASASVGVVLEDDHVIEAKHVVLATGYVMPEFVKSDLHRIVSSFAIATPPQNPKSLWRDGVLIWEAAENYLYTRTMTDGRIVAGGEDDDQAVEPEQREKIMPQKAEAVLRRLATLWPQAEATADFVWSGAFGITSDGLPLIGKVPRHPRIYSAYGYGGNGITFSYMAAQVIGELIAGRPRPWFDDFAIDRDARKPA